MRLYGVYNSQPNLNRPNSFRLGHLDGSVFSVRNYCGDLFSIFDQLFKSVLRSAAAQDIRRARAANFGIRRAAIHRH